MKINDLTYSKNPFFTLCLPAEAAETGNDKTNKHMELLNDNLKIEERIFSIRGKQVILDRDLAQLYGVETKVLNQAVKRNAERFPESFMFKLTTDEFDGLVTICDRFESLKHSSVTPHAFTEQGVAMLSAVLRSATAVSVSIKIMESFVRMRQFLTMNSKAHDRFLIIDDAVYLIGASIKDLGKKWFGFTLMENTDARELIAKL